MKRAENQENVKQALNIVTASVLVKIITRRFLRDSTTSDGNSRRGWKSKCTGKAVMLHLGRERGQV